MCIRELCRAAFTYHGLGAELLWVECVVAVLGVSKRVGLEVLLAGNASPGPTHDATATLEKKSLGFSGGGFGIRDRGSGGSRG